MIDEILGLLWKVAKICIPVPVLAIVVILAWWQLDKSTALRHAVDKAIDRYTHTTELAAANATISELKRQQRAGETANSWLLQEVKKLRVAEAAADTINEKKDITYAQALKDAGRGCTLDDADIDGMQHD